MDGMSSNEFGTVNVRRGDRTREIDVLRQRYNRHRETLAALAADAPSEHLATEYARLIRDVDNAIGKLGELEGRKPGDTQPIKTEPGTRPLVTPPGMIMPDASDSADSGTALPRVALIIGAGVLVLVLIGWLMWRASGPAVPAASRTVTAPVTETAKNLPVTPAPKPVVAPLNIEPATQDYGTIRKGTRAVRQFQVVNNSDQTVSLKVDRSVCRCLYYEYGKVPAHGRETLTVTIDAGKARRGALHESLTVSTKKDPAVKARFEVTGTIK